MNGKYVPLSQKTKHSLDTDTVTKESQNMKMKTRLKQELFHDKEYLGLVRLREVMKDLAAMVWRQVTVNILNFDFLPVEMQNK